MRKPHTMRFLYPIKTVFLSLILTFFIFSISFAQVGIGNTSPNSDAILDVGTATSTAGLLLPRVALTNTNSPSPLSTDVAGMIVYNTVSAGDVVPGFYFNNGTDWVKIGAVARDEWKTTGNAGTTSGTNFIGTTDDVSLELFTNNTTRMRVENDGQVTIGYGAGAASTGYQFSVQAPTNNYAVIGNSSGSGRGVYGINTSNGQGITGNNSSTGIGVFGFNTSSGTGVQAQSSGSGYAFASFNTGTGNGIYNTINNSSGTAIYNNLSATGGTGEYINLGVKSGTGVYVLGVDAPPPATPTDGNDGFSFFSDRFTKTTTGAFVNGAVFGGNQYGVGHGIIVNHYGVDGRSAEFNINGSSNSEPAIFSVSKGDGSVIVGQNQNDSPSGTITVADFSYTGSDSSNHIGVSGYSVPSSSKGIGVQGTGGKYGVLGVSSGGDAIFADGDSNASGTKSFVIDHPNDPENKYLKHFSIESNEVLNVYRGTLMFDANGKASVQLPDYYSSINKNASYQLTAIGASMPNLFIEKEVGNSNTFVIAGGISGKKVSWILTAERNDPYLQQNPQKRANIIEKVAEDRGKYLMPQLYNQNKESGMFYKKPEKLEASKAVIKAENNTLDKSSLPQAEKEEDNNNRSKNASFTKSSNSKPVVSENKK